MELVTRRTLPTSLQEGRIACWKLSSTETSTVGFVEPPSGTHGGGVWEGEGQRGHGALVPFPYLA